MKAKLKKYFKEILLFTLIIFVASNSISYYKSLKLNKSKLDIQTFTLLDGINYTIDTNKPLLIHFWTTWCPICKLEASNIEYISKNFQVITIAVNEKSKNDIKKYLQHHNLSFHVINDFDGKLAKKFNIQVYPTTLIYDSKNKTAFSDVGYSSTLMLYLKMLWAGL